MQSSNFISMLAAVKEEGEFFIYHFNELIYIYIYKEFLKNYCYSLSLFHFQVHRKLFKIFQIMF